MQWRVVIDDSVSAVFETKADIQRAWETAEQSVVAGISAYATIEWRTGPDDTWTTYSEYDS